MALTRNPVSFFDDDADLPLHQLYALLEKLYGQSSHKHQYRQVKIPRLIEMTPLPDRYRSNRRVPCLPTVTRLYFKVILARRKTAVTSDPRMGCGPLGIIPCETIPK